MTDELKRRKIVFLSTDGVEQVELEQPLNAVREAGAETELLSPKEGQIQAFNHLDKGDTFKVDRLVGEASLDDYDALVVPGGVANPDEMRTHEDAVRFVRQFVESGKPTAVICHGPWMLVEADVVRGRTVTSWPSLKTDIRNAGGKWVDEEVVVDGNLITSRKPDDLPAFSKALIEQLSQRQAKAA
jgi:protease I